MNLKKLIREEIESVLKEEETPEDIIRQEIELMRDFMKKFGTKGFPALNNKVANTNPKLWEFYLNTLNSLEEKVKTVKSKKSFRSSRKV